MARSPKNTRMCISCRERKDKSEFLRICKTKENEILIEKENHIEGRGIYLCKSEKCFNMMIKKKSYLKSFKCEIPKQIYDEIEIIAKSTNAE